MSDKYEGEVKWFNDGRGFGFIFPVLEGDEVDKDTEYFVHYTSIVAEGFKTLQPGQRVSFEISETPKGVQATNVEVLKQLNIYQN